MKEIIMTIFGWRVMRYLISGGTGAIVDLACLYALVRFVHLWYLTAAVLAFMIAFSVSFTMQKFFTFNDYAKDTLKRQTALYLAVQVFNLGINTLLMYISVDMLYIHYMLSQILTSGVIAVYSFFIFKHFVFVSDVVYTDEH